MTQVLKSNRIQKPRRLIEAARVRGKRRHNEGQKDVKGRVEEKGQLKQEARSLGG